MLFCSLNYTRAIVIFVLLVLLFRVVCRWRIFKRMGVRPWLSLFPGIREYKIFKKCWKAWPYVLLLVLAVMFALIVQISAYLDISLPIPTYVKSNLTVLSIACFMIITITMYRRLAFAFGHDIEYIMGLLFLNPVFMGLLAFSKNKFHPECAGIRGRAYIKYRKEHRSLSRKIVSVISVMVVICTSVGYMGYVMYTEQQPGFLVSRTLDEIYNETSGKVSGRGEVVYPALDEGVIEDSDVRDLYFPDKSDVKETTVYMYLIGSNLEDATGAASVNLAQIKDATAAGSNLKFIIEAGGTGRWFTDGFKSRRTARYMIKDGEVTLLETLPSKTSMSKRKTLKEFLIWANKNYPSDRRMLFFWDHGGGLSGYGVDIINPKIGTALLSMSDIVGAMRSSGQKYDLVAFDACLMQTMEIGQCFEPYADYLLASEESEPGTGMYYTAAFSRLAQEPDLETLKFGAMMCSSYDQSLELLKGEPQPGFTMSMTDLRYMPVVSDTFIGYLEELDANFKHDKDSFAEMSSARYKAYEFQMEDQIDLIDFINQSSLSAYDKQLMINKIKSAIVVRNAASANHINGLAVYMPYDDLYSYSNIYKQLTRLGMDSETKVYNDFASIIGSQKTAKAEDGTKENENYGYYKDEEWYVDGFENYNSSLYRQDVKLTKIGDDYKINLTDEEWETITGYTQGLKIKVGSRYADLGSDDLYQLDSKGRYMLEFDGRWVSINDVLVALHPGTPKKVGKDKIIYTGTVDAMLNFITPITIYLQWVNEGDVEGEGEVLGYLPADEDNDDFDENGMPRGYKQFKSSNVITFLYDWYDEDGNYLSTALGHLPIRVGALGLQVKQKDISSEDYIYYGILRDTMNRTIQTETLHHKPEQ